MGKDFHHNTENKHPTLKRTDNRTIPTKFSGAKLSGG
jgi:hypothetical protein